jgi:hypothetical protein
MLTLPTDDGTPGQLLSTDGSGNLSWSGTGGFGGFAADWSLADGTTKAITHGLGTKDVLISIFDKANDEDILVDSVIRTSTNVVTLTSSVAPSASGWRVLIKQVS